MKTGFTFNWYWQGITRWKFRRGYVMFTWMFCHPFGSIIKEGPGKLRYLIN